jgi:uncharacterized iron-regulated membrane protein
MKYTTRKAKIKVRNWIQRIHLTTTLILGIFIIFEIATGTVLLFWDQLETTFYPQFFQATSEVTVSYQEIYNNIRTNYPAWENIELRNLGKSSAITAFLYDNDEIEPELTVYIDPGTGQINGQQAKARNLLYFLWRLHKNLWLETHIGVPLLGLVAGIPLIIMLLTGLYLWFPKVNSWSSAFRLRRRNALIWNYSIHKLIGISVVLPLLIIIMPMVMGYNLGDWVGPLYKFAGLKVVAEPEVISTPNGKAPLPLDAFVQSVKTQYPEGKLTSIFKDEAATNNGVVNLYVEMPDHPARDAHYADVIGMQFSFDQYSGKLLAVDDPRHWPFLTRLLVGDWMFALHYGTWGGMTSRILEAIVSALALYLSWTGVRQWWLKQKIRNAGRSSPQSAKDHG